MKRNGFKDVESGTTKEVVFIISGMTEKVAKTGNKYICVSAFDSETPCTFNLFDMTLPDAKAQGIGTGVLYIGKFYLKGQYYSIDGNIVPYTGSDVTLMEFARKAPIDTVLYYNGIINTLDRLLNDIPETDRDTSIASMTKKILDENKDTFIYSSAAVSVHHNCIGGLLMHTAKMMQAAWQIQKIYTNLDKELLICGTILHDIGKLKGYATDALGNSTFTEDGELFEHAFLGIELVKKVAEEEYYDEERVKLLEHMIASHHGKLEWGAITMAQIPEACVLSYLDMIDSRLYIFDNAYQNEAFENNISSNKIFGLDTRIYKSPDKNWRKCHKIPDELAEQSIQGAAPSGTT